MKLNKFEENLSPEELFFKWLTEEKVNFVKISEKYTKYLEDLKRAQGRKNSRYATLLAQYLQFGKLKDKNEWVKDKTIGILYAYEDFKTAPIYEEWAKIVNDKKINTDIETLDWKIYEEEE